MRFLKNLAWVIIGLLIIVAPSAIGFACWILLHPINFWQKFALFAVELSVLGPLQLWCFVIGGCIFMAGCSKDVDPRSFQISKNRVERY